MSEPSITMAVVTLAAVAISRLVEPINAVPRSNWGDADSVNDVLLSITVAVVRLASEGVTVMLVVAANDVPRSNVALAPAAQLAVADSGVYVVNAAVLLTAQLVAAAKTMLDDNAAALLSVNDTAPVRGTYANNSASLLVTV